MKRVLTQLFIQSAFTGTQTVLKRYSNGTQAILKWSSSSTQAILKRYSSAFFGPPNKRLHLIIAVWRHHHPHPRSSQRLAQAEESLPTLRHALNRPSDAALRVSPSGESFCWIICTSLLIYDRKNLSLVCQLDNIRRMRLICRNRTSVTFKNDC